MIKVFIDANVIISVLNREYPVFRMSARLLSLADSDGYTFYTSDTCLAISFYFASKKCDEAKALEKIKMLCLQIKVAPAGPDEVAATLANAKVKDFEDGIQHYAALHSGCQYIVTENQHDFYFSQVPVMNCETFLREVALPKHQKNKPASETSNVKGETSNVKGER